MTSAEICVLLVVVGVVLQAINFSKSSKKSENKDD